MIGFSHIEDYGRAREVFEKADFTEKGISRAIGREELLRMPASDLPPVLRRTRGPSPLNILIHLLYLGRPVPVEEARSGLAPMPLETWFAAGLLLPPDGQGQVEPRVQIWPLGRLTLAVDLPWRRSTAPETDFVVPPGGLTLQLADAMIRRPCKSILDLGTGSGMLALVAAGYAESVVATDKNERAIGFARFNARLNGIENILFRAGDLFEPVSEQRFQLILCNPPFVISPNQRFLFRDSPERGDRFCRRLVRAAVEHLEPGGYFQFTANVAHEVGFSFRSALEEWFAGLECDVLALVEGTEDASTYAMNWILNTESKDPGIVPQLYENWMNFLEKERIEAVSYVLITLQRSAGGPNWVQIDDPPCQIVAPCGEELIKFFETRGAFNGQIPLENLLGGTVRLAPQIRIEQEYSVRSGSLELESARVKKTGGLQYPLSVHPNVARLLARCDGSQSLREVLGQMADDLGIEWDRGIEIILPAVRSLIERGVLLCGDLQGE